MTILLLCVGVAALLMAVFCLILEEYFHAGFLGIASVFMLTGPLVLAHFETNRIERLEAKCLRAPRETISSGMGKGSTLHLYYGTVSEKPSLVGGAGHSTPLWNDVVFVQMDDHTTSDLIAQDDVAGGAGAGRSLAARYPCGFLRIRSVTHSLVAPNRTQGGYQTSMVSRRARTRLCPWVLDMPVRGMEKGLAMPASH